MNESNFFEEEIKSAICGLCNVGGGYIFYAKKSITNIIK
jgi:hypothetical protein